MTNLINKISKLAMIPILAGAVSLNGCDQKIKVFEKSTSEKLKLDYKDIQLNKDVKNKIQELISLFQDLYGDKNSDGSNKFKQFNENTVLTGDSVFLGDPRLADSHIFYSHTGRGYPSKLETEFRTGSLENLSENVRKAFNFFDHSGIELKKKLDDKEVYFSNFGLSNDSTFYWMTGSAFSPGNPILTHTLLKIDPRDGMVRSAKKIQLNKKGQPVYQFEFQIKNGIMVDFDKSYNEFSTDKDFIEDRLYSDLEEAKAFIKKLKNKYL